MLYKESQTHMKSTFTLSSYDLGARDLFKDAFDLIAAFENKYSVFKDSYFNNINKQAGLNSVCVDDETIEILSLSEYYFNLSSGSFDICFENSKYNFLDIQINKNKKTVFLPFSDMKLNLGGIGKGFCVDKVFNFLKTNGLQNFCVNGGGDMRVHSSPNAPRPWRIGIQNPFNTQNIVGHVTLSNQALATSGTYLKGNHIQRTGESEILSISIMEDVCLKADVLATIGMTKNLEESISYYDKYNIWATIITNDGKVRLSKKAYTTHMGHQGDLK